MEIAKLVCSDCGESYFAEIVCDNGRYSIGATVEVPPAGTPYRTQRMLCRDCQGKGGPGDQLQKLMARQRAMMGELIDADSP
jgi:hypothetical protein